jgi:hypothetical protein
MEYTLDEQRFYADQWLNALLARSSYKGCQNSIYPSHRVGKYFQNLYGNPDAVEITVREFNLSEDEKLILQKLDAAEVGARIEMRLAMGVSLELA